MSEEGVPDVADDGDLVDERAFKAYVDGELERIRENFADDELADLGFYVRVLGGRWTALHRVL